MVLTVVVVTGPSHVLNETLIALTLHSAQPRCGVRGLLAWITLIVPAWPRHPPHWG